MVSFCVKCNMWYFPVHISRDHKILSFKYFQVQTHTCIAHSRLLNKKRVKSRCVTSEAKYLYKWKATLNKMEMPLNFIYYFNEIPQIEIQVKCNKNCMIYAHHGWSFSSLGRISCKVGVFCARGAPWNCILVTESWEWKTKWIFTGCLTSISRVAFWAGTESRTWHWTLETGATI